MGDTGGTKTDTIQIKGITEQIDKVELKRYFEDKTKSGGGQIESITYDTNVEGVALLRFREIKGLNILFSFYQRIK